MVPHSPKPEFFIVALIWRGMQKLDWSHNLGEGAQKIHLEYNIYGRGEKFVRGLNFPRKRVYVMD